MELTSSVGKPGLWKGRDRGGERLHPSSCTQPGRTGSFEPCTPASPLCRGVTASSRTALPGQERHEPGGVPQGGSRSARSHSRDQKAQGTDEQRPACQGGEEQAGPLAGSPSVTWLCLKSKAGASDAASSVLLLSTAPWQLQTAARTGPSSKNNP